MDTRREGSPPRAVPVQEIAPPAGPTATHRCTWNDQLTRHRTAPALHGVARVRDPSAPAPCSGPSATCLAPDRGTWSRRLPAAPRPPRRNGMHGRYPDACWQQATRQKAGAAVPRVAPFVRALDVRPPTVAGLERDRQPLLFVGRQLPRTPVLVDVDVRKSGLDGSSRQPSPERADSHDGPNECSQQEPDHRRQEGPVHDRGHERSRAFTSSRSCGRPTARLLITKSSLPR